MADVPCSVPLSKKHIYDGLLSSPAPTKRNESAFSMRIDDYREIFSPSKASLGLSIPTLDLPAVDQSDSSSVDYAGVFGGLGDDNQVETSAGELFRKSKRKSKRNSQPSRCSTQTKITASKSRDLSCNSGNCQTSTSPAQTEIPPSKSQELCGSSKNIGTSTSVSSHQTCDAVKDIDDSHEKTNRSSNDSTDGTTNIGCLHTVPEYTHKIDEVRPTREAGLGEAKRMSTDKQANDHDSGLQKEFDRDKCYTIDASHSTREADCKSQTYSVSTLSSSPKLFSSHDYFRRSSSQSSKSSTSNQQSSVDVDSSPILNEELDVNSAAAVSAAAMKRAIEEAEAKIRSAREILKGQEIHGSGRLSFKNSFKGNATSETNHSYGACGLTRNEDKLLQKDDLKIKARSENTDFNEAGGLKVKLNGVADQVGVEETHDSLRSPQFVNDAEIEGKAYSHEGLISAEKSHKHEGVGEWEATKHISQLLTGVKNRWVSFISKQADAKKTVLQEDEPSGSASTEQSERSTYQVQEAEAYISATDQDRLENEVEMNGFVSSEVRDSAQENNVKRIVALEEGKVGEVTVSSDVKVPSTGQSNPSEPEKESDKVEVQESVEVKHKLIQEYVQGRNQEILDDSMKSERDINELEQHDVKPEATYQTRRYDLKERNCEENNEIEEQVLDQGSVEEEVYESFDDEDGNWRQEEGCSCVETEVPTNCEKKFQHIEMEEDTLKERVRNETFEFQDVKGKATVGLSEVVDDTSEHDADNARELACADNVCEHEESLLLSKNKEACLHVERSLNAQLVESSSGVEGRMANLAASPIEQKVNDEQPIIESKVNGEQPIIEPKVNGEQLIIEPKVNGEQPITEPKVNDEQPVIEPKVNDEQPIIEPKVYDEQPIIEPKLTSEQPIIERKVDDEHPVIEPKVDDEQPIIGTKVNDEPSIIEPKVNDEQPIIEPKVNDEHSIIEPMVNDEQLIIEPKVTDEQPIIEPKATDEQLIIEPKVEDEQPIVEPKVNDDQLITEPKVNDEQPILKPKVNIEQPIRLEEANQLVKEDTTAQPWCSFEVADNYMEHENDFHAVDDLCKQDEKSSLTGTEASRCDDGNQHSQDVDFTFEKEGTAESTSTTSETKGNLEQPRFIHTINELIGKEMLEPTWCSIEVVNWTFDHGECPPRADDVQQETDLNFEQKHVDEETFTTDIGLENQVDESLFRTDMGEVDMASDLDKTMYDVETSNKRKRCFEKDEMKVFYQPDILLGDEINQESDQENAEGSTVDETVSESEECTNVRQDGACSGLEDGHSTKPTQRRRRWFQNRGEEVIYKPSVFYVAEMTTEMDDEIAQISELDNSLQDCVDNSVNDQVESSTSSAEAAPRRRRWFENGEKSGPAQRPSILVDNVIDAAIHDETGQKSTAGIMSNKTHDQLNDRVTRKEKERRVVDRAIRAARLRAFVEARHKAAAAAQDKQGKASSEAKIGSDRASMDAKLRTERAAVERATVEARERAMQKAMFEKAASESIEKDPENQTSGPSHSKGYPSEKSGGATCESPQRRKAKSERNRRTMERAAKALEEKNSRDSIAEKEQSERDMFADILDSEVKIWLTGKEGNLRALLSTLQYILGPDSGWQPIPLADLVNPTAVRKAYKRAALCVHPDKLQQRGATIQQKYICEKVFDLLKDAWKWHQLLPDDI